MRLHLYVGTITVAAIAALGVAAWGTAPTWSDVFVNGLIAVFAVALAAEVSSVSVQLGTATVSIAFIPFLAATFLFDTVWAMAIGGATFGVVDAFVRKKPFIKIAFNASKEILAIGLASTAYQLLGGVPSVTDFDLAHLAPLAILGTVITYSATSAIAVSLVFSIAEGIDFGRAWVRLFGGSVVYDVFATPIPALLAFLYTEWQLVGVVALTVPLFVIRHIYVQNLRLEQASRDLLEVMVKNIEARDPYTSGHSQRVSQYARILAREAGVGIRHVEQIATAALLHDVGKVYNEYAPLLQKEGKLSPEEKLLLQTHPVKSAELVASIASLRGNIERAVRHHHENYDGTGYPDGLNGEAIPIGARIVMIADTLDAMTTDRPYRRALPFDRVIEELKSYSGRQFDPALVEITIRSTAIRRLAAQVTAPTTLQRPPARLLERAMV